MSLPEVQDAEPDEWVSRLRSIARRLHVYLCSLPEEHGRRHAAVEALKIGFGGFAYAVTSIHMNATGSSG